MSELEKVLLFAFLGVSSVGLGSAVILAGAVEFGSLLVAAGVVVILASVALVSDSFRG